MADNKMGKTEKEIDAKKRITCIRIKIKGRNNQRREKLCRKRNKR
jgi:hypothetical protein